MQSYILGKKKPTLGVLLPPPPPLLLPLHHIPHLPRPLLPRNYHKPRLIIEKALDVKFKAFI